MDVAPMEPPGSELSPPAAGAQLTRGEVPSPRQTGEARSHSGPPTPIIVTTRAVSGWPLAFMALSLVTVTDSFAFVLLIVVKLDARGTIALTVALLTAVATFIGAFVLSGSVATGLLKKMGSAATGAINGWRR